jgi:hypothetical protein
MKVYAFISLIFVSLSTFAGLTEDYEALKNSGRDFEPTGAICEEVARLRFAEKYPEPEFTAVTGIQYLDGKTNQTIGELDLVVFDNATQVAKIIGEVKCYTSPKSGIKKAKDQKLRFQKHVHSSKALTFKWLWDNSKKLTKTQFNKTNVFLFIGQDGTQKHGYNVELPYKLDELMQLREDIMACQASNQCKPPRH